MNTKVVFYIATEFHYLAAQGILTSVLKNVDPSSVCFLIRQEPGRRSRLDDISIPDRFETIKICFSHTDGKLYNDVIDTCELLLKKMKISHFVSFLFHDPLYVYLSYQLQRNGTTVALAPDGMGVYVKFKSATIRSRWIHTKNSYRFFKTHNLKFNKWWFASWDFGKNGYFTLVYSLTKEIPFLKNVKVEKFTMQFNKEYLEELYSTFHFNLNSYPLKRVVLVISENKANLEYEKKLIECIKTYSTQYRILFKTHPNQPFDLHSELKDYGITIVKEIFPIELLIASLEEGFVISSYSNSMLFNNPKLQYIWTYPLIEKCRYNLKPIKRMNPTQHIKTAATFEEIGVILKMKN